MWVQPPFGWSYSTLLISVFFEAQVVGGVLHPKMNIEKMTLSLVLPEKLLGITYLVTCVFGPTL